MSNHEGKLRAREWLLIIIVLMIGEYVFIDKVFKYGSDQGVIGYVSFAGTIVSIILAVLAIVYSYYQNFAQKRDSSNIASQIDLLRTTVNDVRLSKAEFADELKRINDVSDKLDQSLSMVGESKMEVLKLSSEFDVFRKSFETVGSHAGKSMNTVVETKNQDEFFSKLSGGVQEVLYALYVSKDLTISRLDRAKRYADLASKHYKADVRRQFLGACLATLSVFQSLGLINQMEQMLVFDEGLARFLTEQIATGKSVADKTSKSIVEDIRAGKMTENGSPPV